MISGLLLIILFIWIIVINNKLGEIETTVNEMKSCLIRQMQSSADAAHSIKKAENKPEVKIAPIEEEENEPEELPYLINSKETFSIENTPSFIEKNLTEDNNSSDFEKLFLGNLFNKIGAIALIIGIGIFIKLIAPYIVFTPVMKVITGFAAGLILIILGFRLHKSDKLKSYSEVLIGTGFASLFITTYCAATLLNVFGAFESTVIASALLIITYIIADKMKTTSMLVISLIAGYINPFLNKDVSITFLFTYLFFINGLSLLYAYKNNKQSWITYVNLVMTLILMSVKTAFHGSALPLTHPLCLWGMYLAYDMLSEKHSSEALDKQNLLNWLNFGTLGVFSLIIFHKDQTSLGYLLLAVGLIYAGIVYFYASKQKEEFKPYLYSMLITVIASSICLTGGVYRICFVAFEGLILAVISGKFKLKYLSGWSLGFFITAVIGMLFTKAGGSLCITEDYSSILNPRSAMIGIPLVFMAAAAYFLNNTEKTAAEILKYITIAEGFILIHFEAVNIVSRYENMSLDYIISVLWITYAGLITIIGILKNIKFLKIAGIWLSILTILRIFIFDLSSVANIYKLIAFIVLGVILMIISYFYAKK